MSSEWLIKCTNAHDTPWCKGLKAQTYFLVSGYHRFNTLAEIHLHLITNLVMTFLKNSNCQFFKKFDLAFLASRLHSVIFPATSGKGISSATATKFIVINKNRPVGLFRAYFYPSLKQRKSGEGAAAENQTFSAWPRLWQTQHLSLSTPRRGWGVGKGAQVRGGVWGWASGRSACKSQSHNLLTETSVRGPSPLRPTALISNYT